MSGRLYLISYFIIIDPTPPPSSGGGGYTLDKSAVYCRVTKRLPPVQPPLHIMFAFLNCGRKMKHPETQREHANCSVRTSAWLSVETIGSLTGCTGQHLPPANSGLTSNQSCAHTQTQVSTKIFLTLAAPPQPQVADGSLPKSARLHPLLCQSWCLHKSTAERPQVHLVGRPHVWGRVCLPLKFLMTLKKKPH